MAIQVEVWAKDIEKNLFPANSFLQQARNDNMYVQLGKTVHLPQSGISPGVSINRSTYPGTAAKRTDTIVSYDLDEFTSDPTHITDVEAVEVSYDKRMSVLEDHTNSINDRIADMILVKWAPVAASRIVRTSGAARPGMAPGATGNRKKITKDDFLKAKRILDKDDVPTEGRYVLLPADMYNDLLEDGDILSSEKMGTANLSTGAVGRLLGFEIYIRSKVLVFNNAGTPVVKLPTDAPATTDNAAAIFWHKNYVRRALGTVTVYASENDPLYYGTVLSAGARAGGRRSRTDEKGVVVIIEEATV